MFAILISAGNALLLWLLRAVVIKFVIFTALYLISVELTEAALNAMGSTSVDQLGGAFGALPSNVVWGMRVFRLDFGIPVVLSSAAVAFAIRRLPVIG